MKPLYILRCALVITGFCLSLCSFAQGPKQSLRIQLSYQNPGQYLEQAIETIEAVNVVGRATTVEYRAGRSVTLRPGFEAKSGSVFLAAIKPVTGENERPLQLKAIPNPFEQVTTIEYYLPAEGVVNLWITDVQGKTVGQLIQGESQAAGRHTVEWKPATAAPGVYLSVIESNQQKAVSRVVKK